MQILKSQNESLHMIWFPEIKHIDHSHFSGGVNGDSQHWELTPEGLWSMMKGSHLWQQTLTKP